MNTLNLHGVKHMDVKRLVESFLINQSLKNNYFSATIITGNSEKMKDLVVEVVKLHGFVYARDINKGEIFITGC